MGSRVKDKGVARRGGFGLEPEKTGLLSLRW